MKVAFVANVGNRDVAVNTAREEEISPVFATPDKGEPGRLLDAFLRERFGVAAAQGARPVGQVLLRHYDELRSRIALLLLGPSLDEVQRHLGRPPDLIVLVATDQTDPQHRNWDTVELAAICQRWLRDHGYGSAEVQIEPVRFNPSRSDLALTFMEQLMWRFRRQGYDRLYASIRGGTPALVAALREQAVNVFGAQAFLIEVDEQAWEVHAAGRPGPTRRLSSWPFRRSQVLRMVEALLDRHDYPAVIQFLQRERCLTPPVEAVLRHALARLNLAFQDAQKHASTLPEDHPLRPLLQRVPDPTSPGILREVVAAAEVAYDRSDWSGFVVRVASFCEYTRWLVVYGTTGVRLDEEGRLSEHNLQKLRQALPSFQSAAGGNEIRLDRRFYHELFRALKREAGIPVEALAAIEEALAPLGHLEKLRHRAVHRLRGVSGDELHPSAGSNPLSALRSAALKVLQHLPALAPEAWSRPPGPDPGEVYRQIRRFVLDELERTPPCGEW